MTRPASIIAALSWAVLSVFSTSAYASNELHSSEKKSKETKDDRPAAAVPQPYGYIAPAALSSPNLASGAAWLFQPLFDAGDFSGDVRAYRLNTKGVPAATSSWRALDRMNDVAASNAQFWNNARIIFTTNGEGTGIPLRYNSLAGAQRAAVGSEDVVNYVRGKRDIAVATSRRCTGKDENDEDDSSDDKKTLRKSSTEKVRGGFLKVSSAGSKSKSDDTSKKSDDTESDDKESGESSKDCTTTTTAKLDRPLIGAIVHSRPVYVGPPREGYPFDNYLADFAARMANRKAIVYVGANDGLLHAFDASNGAEIFGFAPSAILGRLPAYASLSVASRTDDSARASSDGTTMAVRDDRQIATMTPAQTGALIHVSSNESKSDDGDKCEKCNKGGTTPQPSTPTQLTYTVDGLITTQDARINNQWRTILVGGLGAGGQSMYALDVTNAGAVALSETAATSLLLWEFDDRKDADFGYSYSRPSIVRLHDTAGTWAVVVGNGYFSEKPDAHTGSGNAALFIINAATGQLIKKLVVDSRADNTPNGLSSPTVIDEDGDFRADYVYAGDLHGNVWKFDIRSANPEQWLVANRGAPLYAARDEGGQPRPITAAPAVGFHPISGFLITVGTGRVLTANDINNDQAQALYGLWDDTSRDQNIARLTTLSLSGANNGSRTLPSVEVDWRTAQGWKVELPAGERILTEPTIRAGRAQFTSTHPKTGENFLNEIELATGSAPAHPFWDLTNDGTLDDDDLVGGKVPVSASQGNGLVSRPTFGMVTPAHDVYFVNRIVTASKQCVEERDDRKKRERDDDEDDDNDGKKSRSSFLGSPPRARYADWTLFRRATSSPFLRTSSTSSRSDDSSKHKDDGDHDDDDEDDDDHAPPPDECVEAPEQGEHEGDDDDSNDRNNDRGGTCGKDFKPEPPPVAIETTSVGTINRGQQEGRNASGRQMWREIVRPEK